VPLAAVRWVPRLGTAATGFVALLVLLGYAAGVPRLTSLAPSWPPMKANTAAALLCLACALALRNGRPRAARAASLALAWLAALVGAVALAEYATGRDVGVDQLLARDLVTVSGPPGRMSPITSATVLLLGVALAALNRRARWPPWAVVGVLLLALTALTASLYGALLLVATTQTAPSTALCLLALGFGVLASRPGTGPLRILWQAGQAGRLARRLGPLLLAGPLALGLLFDRVVANDQASLHTALTLVVSADVLFVACTVGVVVRAVDRSEAGRARLEAERDASARKATAAAERVRLAERATGRGSWEWDTATDRAQWSDGMYRLFGLDPATFVNSNENFLALVHPDDRARMVDAMGAALQRPGPFRQEYRLRRPDGRWMQVHGEGDVLPGGLGRPTVLFGFVQDVTAEREQQDRLGRLQERFRRVFDSSPIGIVLSRPDGRFVDANPAFQQQSGYSLQELQDPSFTAYQVWERAAARDEAVRQLREGHRVRDLPMALRDKSGRVHDMELSMDMLDVGGETLLLTLAVDVTERQAAARERQARQAAEMEVDRLRRTEAFRRDFVNRTAHEFGTPLTPMLLDLHVLEQAAGLGDRERRALDSLRRNTRRLQELARNTVDAARVQTAQVALALRSVPVAELLGRAADQVADEARRKSIQLAVEPTDATAAADPERLGLALGHLVGNAVKFTPRGGLVRLRAEAEPGAVRIEVQDSGPGLTPAQVAQLWQPYSQVHDPMQASAPGTGLGLFIARSIVALHGGDVGVRSGGPGKGSVFWFTVPVSTPVPVAPPAPA